jgi:hypothetical protein
MFCTQCGTPLKDSQKFCTTAVCGLKVKSLCSRGRRSSRRARRYHRQPQQVYLPPHLVLLLQLRQHVRSVPQFKPRDQSRSQPPQLRR